MARRIDLLRWALPPGGPTFVLLAGGAVSTLGLHRPSVPIALVVCGLLTVVNLAYARARGPRVAAIFGAAAIAPLAIGASGALDAWMSASPAWFLVNSFVSGAFAYFVGLGLAAVATAYLGKTALRLPLLPAKLASLLAVLACSLLTALALFERRTHDDVDAWLARTTDLGGLDAFSVGAPSSGPPECDLDHGPRPGPCARSMAHKPSGLASVPPMPCAIDVVDEANHPSRLVLRGDVAASACAGAEVRRVARTAWLVTPLPDLGHAVGHVFVDGDPQDHVARSIGDLGPWLAPPLPWSLSALAGIVVAIVLLVVPRDRALRDKRSWREETRQGVAVLVHPRAPNDTYRSALDASDPDWVVPGTHATAVRAWEHARAGRYAFAGMTLVLFSTPLLVAVARGLLW